VRHAQIQAEDPQNLRVDGDRNTPPSWPGWRLIRVGMKVAKVRNQARDILSEQNCAMSIQCDPISANALEGPIPRFTLQS